MAYTPDKCLSELKKVIDKLREVKFKDIIKADDDNLKIDALKWIYNTLYSMSRRFNYGDYLGKVSNLISKLKYVKDCPYDYEECLKHPEYFVYSDLHSNIIDTIINVKNALKNVIPQCYYIEDMVKDLESALKFISKPSTGFIVSSYLHNLLRSCFYKIYNILSTMYQMCYYFPLHPFIPPYGDLKNTNTNVSEKVVDTGTSIKCEIKSKIEISDDLTEHTLWTVYVDAIIAPDKRHVTLSMEDYLYVINGETWEIDFQLSTFFPYAEQGLLGYPLIIATADVEGEGKCKLIIPNLAPAGWYDIDYYVWCERITEEFNWITYLTRAPYRGSMYRYGARVIPYNPDRDGREEIVVGLTHISYYSTYYSTPLNLFVLDDDGTILTHIGTFKLIDSYSTGFWSNPYDFFVYDVDADGIDEIVYLDFNENENTYYLKCYDGENFNLKWQVNIGYHDFPPQQAFDYDALHLSYGEEIQRIIVISQDSVIVVTPTGYIEKTIPITAQDWIYSDCVFDFDGDGFEEVVYNDGYSLYVVHLTLGTVRKVLDEVVFTKLFAIDINNDDALELLGVSTFLNEFVVMNGRTENYVRIDTTKYDIESPRFLAFSDVDLDGSAELIILQDTGKPYPIYKIHLYVPI